MTSSRRPDIPRPDNESRSDDDEHGGDIASGFGAPKRQGEPISDEKAEEMLKRRHAAEDPPAETDR